jgi:tetrapyrrole methylase family protein/MazG family protein
MKRYILEECYELLEALDEGDSIGLTDELGDVLFHLAFQVQLGVEDGTLVDGQVFRAVIEKLTRRHPHVFGGETATDARQVEANWSAIKRAERTDEEAYFLDGVPRVMPALSYAQAIQQKAAYTGFDWEDAQAVLEKVGEEVEGLRSAKSPEDMERELGDLLFSIVHMGRWLGADAESALRGACARFRRRFDHMEKLSRERGDSFDGLTLDQKEDLWQTAKRIVG